MDCGLFPKRYVHGLLCLFLYRKCLDPRQPFIKSNEQFGAAAGNVLSMTVTSYIETKQSVDIVFRKQSTNNGFKHCLLYMTLLSCSTGFHFQSAAALNCLFVSMKVWKWLFLRTRNICLFGLFYYFVTLS